jgi:hypothetical protein
VVRAVAPDQQYIIPPPVFHRCLGSRILTGYFETSVIGAGIIGLREHVLTIPGELKKRLAAGRLTSFRELCSNPDE